MKFIEDILADHILVDTRGGEKVAVGSNLGIYSEGLECIVFVGNFRNMAESSTTR